MTRMEKMAAFAGLQIILLDEFNTVDFLPLETFGKLQSAWNEKITNRDEFYDAVLACAKRLAEELLEEEGLQ